MGIQLGGEVSYFGKTEIKPFIGDRHRDPEAVDISLSIRLIAASAGLMLLSAGAVIIAFNHLITSFD